MKIDLDDEKAEALTEVKLAIKRITAVMAAGEADPRLGKNLDANKILEGAKQLKPYLERHAELLGLDAPPHMQRVELSGNLGDLLKLSQSADDAIEPARGGVQEEGVRGKSPTTH
jgi:hypothetical protein